MKNPFEFIKKSFKDYAAVPDEEKAEYKEKLHGEARELNEIKNTAGLQGALENEVPEAAESFLNRVKGEREDYSNYDEGWIDHTERKVFNAYYDLSDKNGAERMLDKTDNIFSKKGRVAKYENKFGEYKKDWMSEIDLREYSQEEVSGLTIKDTASFREALLMQNSKGAEEWLNNTIIGVSYGGMTKGDGKFESFIKQRKDDIAFMKKIYKWDD